MLSNPTRKSLRIVGGADEPEQPNFEAMSAEKAAIKRFLDFALKDLKFQYQALRAELGSPTLAGYNTKLAQLQNSAVMMTKYVEALREGLDQMEQVH